MTLYSYCVRHDAGAAPNPYWGVCTLVICKPAIRRTAEKNDWVVGLGSADSPIGDMSKHVVYAMKVTNRMPMAEYDRFCIEQLPGKVPDWRHSSFARLVGDCIYDFSASDSPLLREGVHDEGNRETDLGGKYALLSDHFWYFGNRPVELPEDLLPIAHPFPGHKSKANTEYVSAFIDWIEGFAIVRNAVHGEPQLRDETMNSIDCRGVCAVRDRSENENDGIC